MIKALYFLFVLSGAAGLIYESIWTRYLGLFVGSQRLRPDHRAGDLPRRHVARRVADRPPVRTGDATRSMVRGGRARGGCIGLVFHDICSSGHHAGPTPRSFRRSAGSLGADGGQVGHRRRPDPAAVDAARGDLPADDARACSGCAARRPGRIALPALLRQQPGRGGRRARRGLLPGGAGGLPGTLLAAAMLNLVVCGGTVVVIVRRAAAEARSDETQAGAGSLPGRPPGQPASSDCCSSPSFGTAIASFIYEIGWIRMLALVLGSATHSFELMLSAFILGLALGALVDPPRAPTHEHSLRTPRSRAVAHGAAGARDAAALCRARSSWMRRCSRPSPGPTPAISASPLPATRSAWWSCCRRRSAPG